MKALLEAVAKAGDRLVKLSHGRVCFNAAQALARGNELDLMPPGLMSPNGHCRLIQTSDTWIAVSLARRDDIDLLPAWLGTTHDDEPWESLISAATKRTAQDLVAAAVELHLPVALINEAAVLAPPCLTDGGTKNATILDMSALWAGPYCGGLLAEAGHKVIKIESPARPDPTPQHTPKLDARLNGRKERKNVVLNAAELLPMIENARAIITSARPHALARLGLDEKEVFIRNPDLLWIAITAHGWHDDAAMRVGFGDDCAAAGGLLRWDHDNPQFIGDALADPLTGIMAATRALEALEAGKVGLLDISLARTAASFAKAIA
ncbi:MAG: CoA transferase [Parasphingorhabdus sp.]|uniref:CoA transferase n=1 Tax=Parasphingorhabdus sp. TaxID=2709688 RepID=UPI0030014D2D